MSATSTSTYTVADVENVMRKFRADLLMIAETSGGCTTAAAHQYAADIELLAKEGCLAYVDLTLMVGAEEKKAVRYTVNAQAGALTAARPGGVMWPAYRNATLRVVLGETAKWTNLPAAADQALRRRLHIAWTSTNVDLSHATLSGSNGRNFVSNGWALERKDYGQ